MADPTPDPTAENSRPAAATRRSPGRPFKPGQSGNPGGRPKGLATIVRELAPARDRAAFYAAVLFAGTDRGLMDDELRNMLGGYEVTLRDRMQAAEWLTDRAEGKAPTHAPVEGENPLELDSVERAIRGIVDELAERRAAAPVGDAANGALADTG